MAKAVRSGFQLERKTMKRMLAVSLVGFVALGSGAQRASAWWLWDTIFNHDCPRARCTQYNAFSPFCSEGYCPMPGNGYGGSPASSFSDGQGYLGELPAPGTVGTPVMSAPTSPPADAGTAPNSSATLPGNDGPSVQPGAGAQAWPAWGPGMVNPARIPGYYPGATNYGPANGIGTPSYYPGFIGYGPGNGFGR
jgi:hypothetical protein